MATITLRQANVVSSPGAIIKGSPLANSEVDNNFANLNVEIGVLADLDTTEKANLVVAINDVNARAIDPIPFAIALS